MATEKQTIDDFEGFDSGDAGDFFGEADIADPIEQEKEDAKKSPKDDKKPEEEENENPESKDKKKPEENESEDEEQDFFNTNEAEEEEEEDDDSEKPKKGDKPEFKSESAKTLKFLQSKGLVNLEDEDGEEIEITDENADDLMEDKWEESVNNSLKEKLSEFPDEIKNLIRFASKGGDTREYLKSLTDIVNSPVNKDADISDEKTQTAAIQEDLKLQGYDDEYIETHIKVLKDSGKLESIGKKAYDKIIDKQKEAEQQRIKQIEDANKAKKQQSREFKKSLDTFLEENKEINGYKITPKERKNFSKYISDPSVELEDGRKITGIQSDIFKAMGDKKKLVLLSKVLQNDFDFSFATKKAVSEDAKNKRNNLRNDEKPKRSSGSTSKSKTPIWDLI